MINADKRVSLQSIVAFVWEEKSFKIGYKPIGQILKLIQNALNDFLTSS